MTKIRIKTKEELVACGFEAIGLLLVKQGNEFITLTMQRHLGKTFENPTLIKSREMTGGVYAVIDGCHFGKDTYIPLQDEFPGDSNGCTCDIKDLCSVGCTCGGFKREQAKKGPKIVYGTHSLAINEVALEEYKLPNSGTITGRFYSDFKIDQDLVKESCQYVMQAQKATRTLSKTFNLAESYGCDADQLAHLHSKDCTKEPKDEEYPLY